MHSAWSKMPLYCHQFFPLLGVPEIHMHDMVLVEKYKHRDNDLYTQVSYLFYDREDDLYKTEFRRVQSNCIFQPKDFHQYK